MDDQEYRARLTHDLAAWEREGIVTGEQRQAILARAGAASPRYARGLRLGWLVTAAAIVGALVLGAGVILLFAASWRDMAAPVRVGLLMLGMIAAYAAGYALMYRYQMQRIGSGLLLLAVVLYQGSIFLIADTYNIATDNPWLWLLAAIGTFPLAYLLGSRIVLLVALADTLVWVAMGLSRRYPDSPQAQAAMLIVGVFAVGLFAIGRLHLLRSELARFGDVYRFAGLLVLLGLLYAFSFNAVWSDIEESGAQAYSAPNLVYVSVALCAALLAGVYVAARPSGLDRVEYAAAGTLLALGAVVATWPVWSGYSVLFSLVFFAIVVGLVLHGNAINDERYLNLGLAGLALGLMTRYVDVFWSQLATSTFFIIGGLLLFAVAFGLERLRRRLLADDRGGAAPPAGHQGAAI